MYGLNFQLKSAGSRPPFRDTGKRRGAVSVLVVVMLIAILACTALCIDIGWGALAQSQLQNAADSASAAGAAQLITNYSAYSIPSQSNQIGLIFSAKSSASSYCFRFAGYNKAGDVSSLALTNGDIQIGFTDASGYFDANSWNYPNTVKVKTRRDTTANGSLPLFIAPVLGTSKLNLTATSSATIYCGLISSFNPNGGGEVSSGITGGLVSGYNLSGSTFDCTLLPVAFDVNSWKQFLSTGASPDGTIQYDGGGTPQIKVYPSPKNSPGNFGMLCIGPWTNSNSIYSNWVLNGPNASDIAALIDAGSFPVRESAPKAWKGSPGVRSSLSSEFSQIIGHPRLLPLFKPAALSPYQAASGSGSNTTYDIVGFAGVKVNLVTGNGGNLYISIQPCDVIDPTAVFDSATVYPLGAEPMGQVKSFAPPAAKFTT